jgi:hypothetical protein
MLLRSPLNPIGKQFLYEGPGGEPSGTVHIDGKLDYTPTGMKGNGFLTTGNQLGPVGSEYCTTAYSDWSAINVSPPKKKRKK